MTTQLVDDLITKINNKTYDSEDKLPSERELCEIYGMSRITVRNALQELEREGYVHKVHGKGTFVSSSSYRQKLVKLYSFTEEMRKIGKTPKTQVLSFKRVESDKRIAEKLKITPGDSVYLIVRLRFADDEPLIYETSYIPESRFPDLSKEELEKTPMYTLFFDKYSVSVTRAVEQFSATILSSDEGEYLQTSGNQPGMLVKRTAYYNTEIIEYTVSVTAGDKFTYTVELD